MKKARILLSSIVLLSLLFFQSCIEDKCKNKLTYTRYDPVYMPMDDIRIDIRAEAARDLENPGKIYFYNNYVLINELREGIHIIDNADPSNPNNVAFIPIPGNVDMAVKNNILYADNYMDLLTIDISTFSNPVLKKRVEDVFGWYYEEQALGVLVYHERTNVTETFDCYSSHWGDDVILSGNGGEVFVDPTTFDGQTGTVGTQGGEVGIAGSMARFGIVNDYLYALDEGNMDVFSINTIDCPELRNTVYVGWNIETIFPHGNHLFIGAADGMYIFDNSNPESPNQLSKFQHARACDPVYVSGNRAFVTLRSGNPECDGFTNQMDIIDINDLTNPTLMKSYEMSNPHGLSITPSEVLYLGEGSEGIRVLDVEDTYNVHELGRLKGFDAYDVIALGENHIMVIGADGFYQFDTSDKDNIRQLSVIPNS